MMCMIIPMLTVNCICRAAAHVVHIDVRMCACAMNDACRIRETRKKQHSRHEEIPTTTQIKDLHRLKTCAPRPAPAEGRVFFIGKNRKARRCCRSTGCSCFLCCAEGVQRRNADDFHKTITSTNTHQLSTSTHRMYLVTFT